MEVGPQETKQIALNYQLPQTTQELLLNVAYKLKKSKQLIPAGYLLAEDQLTIQPYARFDATIAEGGEEVGVYEDLVHVILTAGETQITFDKRNGWIRGIAMNGLEMLKYGSALRPNFWRAPTDNDMGAGLHNRFQVWKNPDMKKKGFKVEQKDRHVFVTVDYDLPAVAAPIADDV